MDEVSDRPPYEAYATIVATFVASVAAVAAAARRLDRGVELRPLDLPLLGLATFKGARTLARDPVTSFVREPFVEEEAYRGDEHPAGEGMRRAIGELVTCTRCAGTWVAAALASLTVLAPRTGRLLASVLAAGALNDFLQAAFVGLTAKANELERGS